MIFSFKSKIIKKINKNNLLVNINSSNVLAWNNELEKLNLNSEYEFYCFEFLKINKKNIINKAYYCFLDLGSAIFFSDLLELNSVGIKTAEKILLNYENNKLKNESLNLTKKQKESLNKYNNIKFEEKNTESNEIKEDLFKLGYDKQIITKILIKEWDFIKSKTREEKLNLLIKKIANEMKSNKTK